VNAAGPRLPEVTPAKLWRVPLEVLIDRLPNVPVMLLDFWNRPQVDPDPPPGVATLVFETTTVYELSEARDGEWARLVSSPAPFDAIWEGSGARVRMSAYGSTTWKVSR